MTKPTGWQPIEVAIATDPGFKPIEVGAVASTPEPTTPAKSATLKES